MTDLTSTPPVPDWRELRTLRDALEELTEVAASTAQSGDTDGLSEVVAAARAALATTPPAPPRDAAPVSQQGAEISDRELEAIGDTIMGHVCPVDQQEMIEYGRAVWARAQAGRPAIQPVPVSERPCEREGWCDAEGHCWRFDPCERGWWSYGAPTDLMGSPVPWTHMAPHWAFPLPVTD